MALSSQSKTFVDAKKELENKIVETGSADATDVSNISNKYGITVEDFKQANSELKKMQEGRKKATEKRKKEREDARNQAKNLNEAKKTKDKEKQCRSELGPFNFISQ